MADERCEIRTRVDYRSAPLQILEDSRLSADAKVFATWSLMHGNGWQLRIAFALAKLRISRARWARRVRKELAGCGYFIQQRTRGLGKNGRLVFEWKNILTDEPLYSNSPCTHFAAMETESLQNGAIQNAAITSTQENKNKSSQKKREKPAALACSSVEEIFQRLLSRAALSKNSDAARDNAAINEARSLIVSRSLDAQVAIAAMSMCRWPSEALPSLLTAAEHQQRQLADQRHEAAKKNAVARVEEQMRQQNQPADPVATASRYLPGLGRGLRPLASPTADGGR